MTPERLDTRVTNGQFISIDGLANTNLTVHNGKVVDDDTTQVWRNVNASGHLVLPGMIQAIPTADDGLLLKVRGGTTTGISSEYVSSQARLDVLPQIPESITIVEPPESGELTDDEWDRLIDAPDVHVQAGAESDFAIIHFLYHEGHTHRGMPLERIAALTSANIASAAGLFPRKGSFETGSDGDLFVFDPDGEDPYSDIPWPGRVIFSLQRGSILLFNGQIHTSPGDGRKLS